MSKIDWKRKLSSRKLWAAVAALATNLIIAFGGSQETAVQVSAIVMATAAVIAYIVGEGLVDVANAGYSNGIYEPDDPPEEDEEVAAVPEDDFTEEEVNG